MLAYRSKWSESWIASEFTHRGTNVPKRLGPRIELSRRLAEFLARQAEYEVAFADVTAARACAAQKEIVEAQQAVRLAKSDATATKRARDTAEKKLRWDIHCVVRLLSVVIEEFSTGDENAATVAAFA